MATALGDSILFSLSAESFINFISSKMKLFLDTNQTPGVSCSNVWESLKTYLRGQIISYCANKKKTKTNTARLKELTDQILELDTLYSHQPSADIMKKHLSLQTEFDILSAQHAEYLLSMSTEMLRT